MIAVIAITCIIELLDCKPTAIEMFTHLKWYSDFICMNYDMLTI